MMWNSIVLIIFICNTTVIGQLISDIACYRLDQKPSYLESELKPIATPNSFLNMVEQFTSMEQVVMDKAGEKLIEDENVTIREYFRLGVFRKSNFFYLLIVCFYLYWLFYVFSFFKNSRKQFDQMIESYREFHHKNIIMTIYACSIALAAYSIFCSAQWVGQYSDAAYTREERMKQFLNEYEIAVNLTSSLSVCYMDKMTTELDELIGFHRRIHRYYHQKIPRVADVLKIVSEVIKTFESACNITTKECVIESKRVKMNETDLIFELIRGEKQPDFSNFPNWDEYSNKFEETKHKHWEGVKRDYSEYEEVFRQRLMLLKTVYSKIEHLFIIPSPLIIQVLFGILFVCVLSVILVSIFSLLAMFRDHDYLEANGIARPLASYLRMGMKFIVGVSCFALFYSWIVIVFSSASHSLYLNVLRDRDMEVLGKLNITDANGNSYFNFRDFLNSTNQTVIEDLLSLNPHKILRQNKAPLDNFKNWHEEMLKQLNDPVRFRPPIEGFCQSISTVFNKKPDEWIESKTKIMNLCQITNVECFFCELKKDLEQTKNVAFHIHENFTIANRTGDYLEDFRYLHEKYRLQMWNDYVAPITLLELPSIIILITLLILYFMMMITISIAETEIIKETYEDRHHYYKVHTADRGLYWFNT